MLSSAQDYRKGSLAAQVHSWQATFDAERASSSPTIRSGRSSRRTTGATTPSRRLLDRRGLDAARGAARERRHPHLRAAVRDARTRRRSTTSATSRTRTPTSRRTTSTRSCSDGDWTFGRLGDGYVALYSWRPTEWRRSTTRRCTRPTACCSPSTCVADGGADNVWIVECGARRRLGSFAAFRAAVADAPVSVTPLGPARRTARPTASTSSTTRRARGASPSAGRRRWSSRGVEQPLARLPALRQPVRADPVRRAGRRRSRRKATACGSTSRAASVRSSHRAERRCGEKESWMELGDLTHTGAARAARAGAVHRRVEPRRDRGGVGQHRRDRRGARRGALPQGGRRGRRALRRRGVAAQLPADHRAPRGARADLRPRAGGRDGRHHPGERVRSARVAGRAVGRARFATRAARAAEPASTPSAAVARGAQEPRARVVAARIASTSCSGTSAGIICCASSAPASLASRTASSYERTYATQAAHPPMCASKRRAYLGQQLAAAVVGQKVVHLATGHLGAISRPSCPSPACRVDGTPGRGMRRPRCRFPGQRRTAVTAAARLRRGSAKSRGGTREAPRVVAACVRGAEEKP